jgi:hypothetical protein
MRSSSRTGHTAKRTKLTDPANRARSLGVAPYAALLVAWSPRSQRAGCVASLRWPLFERMGVSDPSTLAQMAKVERGETVRKGVRATLRGSLWSDTGAKTGRIAPLRAPDRPRFGHSQYFSDSLSRTFISTILNILPYRAGAMRHLAAPMDRMLPQHVVGLDRNSLG